MLLYKKIFRLSVISLIAFVFIKLSTFGFRLRKIVPLILSNQEMETASNLKRIVHFLAGEIGERGYRSYANLNRAADFIISTFQELGYKVDIVSYKIGDQIFRNIVAESPIKKNSDEIIIVGAHYDTCFNPGADDNASAVAGMLELARLLKDEKVNKRLRFVAFVNEEPPFFMTENMGSRVYVRGVKQKKENLKAVIILEMIGYYSEERNSQRYLPFLGPFYPNQANFIAVVGNFVSRGIASTIKKNFQDHSQFQAEVVIAPSFIPGINFSDHWSFWKEGYPAVMITDTAFFRSPHYHRPTDLPETLNYEKMAAVVWGLKYSIADLACK